MATLTPMMEPRPIRLGPGDDLRAALEAVVAAHDGRAAFVVCGIGSLAGARLRFAGRDEVESIACDLEILTLSGTLAPGASHLHASVSMADGRVLGGHVAPGCAVRTTAEVLIALLPDHAFTRTLDPATGYAELAIGPRTA